MCAERLCSDCESRRAVYFDSTSGLRYCASCFVHKVYRGAVRNIKNEHMIEKGDNVMLALSGGKDSVVLADIMAKLAKRFNGITLSAVTIDEGVTVAGGAYRQEAARIARDVCDKLSIPHRQFSYQELFGASLGSYLETSSYKGSACGICGVLRRRALNIAAKDLGATKIATGHNKDDEAQTMLMNLFRGDLDRILRNATTTAGFVPRIKPLRKTSEREIAMYAYLQGFQFQSVECPYSHDTTRDKVRGILETASEFASGTSDALLNLQEKLAELFGERQGNMKPCARCGEPTSPKRTTCKACEFELERNIHSALREESRNTSLS